MGNTTLQASFLGKLGTSGQVLGLFDLLPGISFFIKDRRGRFVSINQRGCEYCGVSQESEAIGRTDHDFFPAQRADEYRADDLSVLNSGEPIINRIESAPEAAGSPRLVITSKIPLRDVNGRIIGIAGFSRQVDELRSSSATVADFADVVAYMHAHYFENLTTPDLAAKANLSPSQFERRFRKAFSASVRQYLIRIRIENAAKMLSESEATISTIALNCGFYDHAHFSRCFRRIMKSAPSVYRRHHKPIA